MPVHKKKAKSTTGQVGMALVSQREKRRRKIKAQHDLFEDDADLRPEPNMQSVTEEDALEEFLARADLAGTEFTAERSHMKIMGSEENKLVGTTSKALIEASMELQAQYQDKLKVPRRPAWNASMDPEELTKREKAQFNDWRSELAVLEEISGLVLTPFEKNLELWRQLWRVLERSDIVVQILDARNPHLFRCLDLEKYVTEINPSKRCVLLLNKADLLTSAQRKVWGDHFRNEGTNAVFWSATAEKKKGMGQSSTAKIPEGEEEDSVEEENSGDESEAEDDSETEGTKDNSSDIEEDDKVLGPEELIEFLSDLQEETDRGKGVVVGMVGYPNVGKSSTINRLLGYKKVPVSSTPGKTRHFQTLQLTEDITLCDCPGLVTPSFSFSREDMLLNAIVSVSQMRDYRPAIRLLCSRVPKVVFEGRYGVTLPKRETTDEENPRLRIATYAEDVLTSVAFMRGFMSSKGIPDSSRAARRIITDVISGRLCLSSAPPGVEQGKYDEWGVMGTLSVKGESLCSEVKLMELQKRHLLPISESKEVDSSFFEQATVQGHVKNLKNANLGSKKHHNSKKKQKLRRIYAHKDI